MDIPVLIETTQGRYTARAGGPFALAAEGSTRDEAVQRLTALIDARVRNGAELAVIHCSLPMAAKLRDATSGCSQAPLQLEPLPDDDWFFETLREAIAEERKKEDEAGA